MTKEEVIKYIKQHCIPNYPKTDNTQWDEAMSKAIETLEDSRWIPVTERLPEKTGWYLCTLSGHSRTMVDMCRFEVANGGFWSGGIEYNVMAWAELPEPYKEGAEE